MSVTVRIPTILRQYAGGAATVEVVPEPATLAGALAALDVAAPGIGARIIDDSGKLRRFVNIYLDDEDVRFLDGLATPTPSGTSISVIPAVAGG